MKGLRAWIWILIAIASLVLAFWFGTKIHLPRPRTDESSVVLLEKIRTVCKLVTAEGQFAEIYEYKESYPFDIPLFTKKALVRVRATVSVGYDLAKMKISVDEKSHSLVISDLPSAEILSVDHDLDYYDLTEGFFNKFSTEDYNTMNSRAKEFIVSQVKNSSLMQAADKKRDDMIQVMRYMAEQAGWKVMVVNGSRETKDNRMG
jgi:hypothetical protein